MQLTPADRRRLQTALGLLRSEMLPQLSGPPQRAGRRIEALLQAVLGTEPARSAAAPGEPPADPLVGALQTLDRELEAGLRRGLLSFGVRQGLCGELSAARAMLAEPAARSAGPSR